MTRPINLYALSRVRDEEMFYMMEMRFSSGTAAKRTQYQEMESMRFLTDALVGTGFEAEDLDGFFPGYQIPQIGKEFDLLKFNDKSCLNIELKSEPVPEEQIWSQLLKNRHYLSHLGKRLHLFSVVTKTMNCYRLSFGGELLRTDFTEVADAVKKHSGRHVESIDEMFRASEYLVSPISTPEKFIQREYFLTQAQEQVKKDVLQCAEHSFQASFLHITGKPGTGKTLLIYDIARELSKNGNTLIIQCGALYPGQEKIRDEIENLSIGSVDLLLKPEGNPEIQEKGAQDRRTAKPVSMEDFNFILVDESHRLLDSQFEGICDKVKENDLVCIFSSDPDQVLTRTEKERNITEKIRNLPLSGEFTLSEKIRMNRELFDFISCMKNLSRRSDIGSQYQDVDLNYANTTAEAQILLDYYKKKGYVFINYTKKDYLYSPYAGFQEDFDVLHVIGQEFDQVVMLIDNSFYYDEKGYLQGIPNPDPDYLYPNLFYQGVTRVREKLALIVLDAPELFRKIGSVFAEGKLYMK